MVEPEQCGEQWMSSSEQSSSLSAQITENGFTISEYMITERLKHSQPESQPSVSASDGNTNIAARALSAAGAAFLSAVIVNPLDVAKTRLQAQAAGAPYSHPLSNMTSRMAFFWTKHDVC
ncbi:hypothetical protein Ancab_009885 [Ancistrocladus abbreviatus]